MFSNYLYGYLSTKCYIQTINALTVILNMHMGCLKKTRNFGKMKITCMHLGYLYVLLLYYPFMYNPRSSLGCAIQQNVVYSPSIVSVAGFVSRT